MTSPRTIADGEIITGPPPFFEPENVRRALISLAWTQRRLSRQYRAWADDNSNPDRARRYGDEADRLDVDSRWHFRRALNT